MKRVWLLALSLGMVCFWLIWNYFPQIVPVNALTLPLSNTLAGGITILCFVAFVLIQGWILRSTHSSLSQSTMQQEQPARWQLNVQRELFWTFLPIVMTLLLVWRSWNF